MDEDVRRRKLVTRAEKDPSVMEAECYQDPEICHQILERCEHGVLVDPANVLPLATAVLGLAARLESPHLIARGNDVLAHIFIALRQPEMAESFLDAGSELALSCCNRCRSDFHRRRADLMVETGQPRAAIKALAQAVEEAGDDLTPDRRGRIRFIRCIAFYKIGDRARAVEDAGRALMEIELESPQGYFLDTLALLAIFTGAHEVHCRAGLRHLEVFGKRIQGLKPFKAVRTRRSWVEGHLRACVGDWRRARTRLDTAAQKILFEGLPREAAAVTLDQAQLWCRNPNPDNVRTARRLLERCLRERPEMGEGLCEAFRELTEEVLPRRPEDAFGELFKVRQAFVAPVPGVLGHYLLASSAAKRPASDSSDEIRPTMHGAPA